MKTDKKKGQSRSKYLWLLLAGLMCVMCMGCAGRVKKITLAENLDKTALKIDEKSYTLKDLAFYVAYEEQIVQQQAMVYNSQDPNEYWNLHTNGNFVRVRAREEAMNLAIHDLIFYELAREEAVELSDEEEALAVSRADDFWMDLSDVSREKIGITKEDVTASVKKIALAEKYQEIYAIMASKETADFHVDGDDYLTMQSEHEIKIIEKVWEGLSFGNVTL